MKKTLISLIGFVLGQALALAETPTIRPAPTLPLGPNAAATTLVAPEAGSETPQDREARMYARMNLALAQIAVEYGNPTFVQVFTNDPERGAALRKRLQEVERMGDLGSKIGELEKQRQAVEHELAEKQAASMVLERKLAEQRAALAQVENAAKELQTAVERARQSLEPAKTVQSSK